MNFFSRIRNAVKAFISNIYEGARWSTRRSLLNETLQAARLDVDKCTREELCRKANYFEKNNALFNKLCDLFEQYTVGTGIPFFPATSSPRFNDLAATAWEAWKPMADVASRFGWDSLQSVIARQCFVFGECFVLQVRDRYNGRGRVQLVEGFNCKTPPLLAAQEGKFIVDGVAIDPAGRPLGYWFKEGEDFRYYDASVVVHIFDPSRPGQYRGLPYIHPVINDLHDLDDLQMLEMQAAKQNARISRFVNVATGEFSDEDAIRTGGEVSDEDGKKRFEYYENVLGADAKALFPGDKVSQFGGERPSVVTREFWKGLEAKICAGVGIPYVLVYPESMQGTVYRGALDAASAWFRIRSSNLALHFRRIYEFALADAMQFDPALRAAAPKDWNKADYRPPKAPNVDVGRNSAAMLAELAAGIRSHVGIIAEDGGDWKQLLIQKATVKKFAIELVKLPQFEGVTVEDIIAQNLPNSTPTPAEPDPNNQPPQP